MNAKMAIFNVTFNLVVICTCFTFVVEGIPFFQNRKHGLHPIAALPPIRIHQKQATEGSTSPKPTTTTTVPKQTTDYSVSVNDSSIETKQELGAEFDAIWKWLKNDLVSTTGTIVQAVKDVELPTEELPMAISKVFDLENETQVASSAFSTTPTTTTTTTHVTPAIETIEFEIVNNTAVALSNDSAEVISEALASAVAEIEQEDAIAFNASICSQDGVSCTFTLKLPVSIHVFTSLEWQKWRNRSWGCLSIAS